MQGIISAKDEVLSTKYAVLGSQQYHIVSK